MQIKLYCHAWTWAYKGPTDGLMLCGCHFEILSNCLNFFNLLWALNCCQFCLLIHYCTIFLIFETWVGQLWWNSLFLKTKSNIITLLDQQVFSMLFKEVYIIASDTLFSFYPLLLNFTFQNKVKQLSFSINEEEFAFTVIAWVLGDEKPMEKTTGNLTRWKGEYCFCTEKWCIFFKDLSFDLRFDDINKDSVFSHGTGQLPLLS